jgi:hypothetical protein
MAWPFGYLVGFTGGAFDLHRDFIEATHETNIDIWHWPAAGGFDERAPIYPILMRRTSPGIPRFRRPSFVRADRRRFGQGSTNFSKRAFHNQHEIPASNGECRDENDAPEGYLHFAADLAGGCRSGYAAFRASGICNHTAETPDS